MEFFNNEIASILQYYTFPLEVVGLTLAAIEVRFPGTAELITNRVSDWRSLTSSKIEHPLRFLLIVAVILIPPVFFRGLFTEEFSQSNWMSISFQAYVFIGAFLICVPIVLAPLLLIAQTFVKGRTVGTLGIVIAGFGVLGEAYQFTTQLVV